MDNSSIIEGQVKFRDGKKWKSRWCVMRKLSPVADCLHLQLYRDSKDRYKQSQTKASLSLQYFLGIESGFTLDKESNTIAILCQDLTVVLAFDTRERLIQWQVKIAHNLGEDEQYLIQVVSAPAKSKVCPGPARLHIQDHRFSLTTGLPPRLAAVWPISHLRRYGVVEKRFCFEGGSACGKYEGLYVLVTDQGEEITRSLSLASQGNLIPRRKAITRNMSVLESPRRMSQLKGLDDTMDSEEKMKRSLWESESSCDFGDATSVGEPSDIQVGWKPDRPIGRCISCMSKLGTMSRSSTITPGIGFSAIRENSIGENQSDDSGCSVSNSGSAEVQSSVITSSCLADRISVVESGPSLSKSCHGSPSRKSHLSPSTSMTFENYDVPRKLCVQLKGETNGVDQPGEYYDTPKKIRDSICNQSCQNDRLAHSCLQNPCCTPVYVNKKTCAHSCCHQHVCPCVRKVITSPTSQMKCPCFVNKCQKGDNDAIYAVVDMSKKIKNRSDVCSSAQKEDGVNYENLAFVKSCEYYENVKDIVVWCHGSGCKKCNESGDQCTKGDDYLLMGPVRDVGYLPMDKTKAPLEKTIVAVLRREAGESKSASNTPCLRRHAGGVDRSPAARLRRRSNSMDSGRSLDECQSNAASTDSLSAKPGGVASLQALTKRLLRPCDVVTLRTCSPANCQELRPSPAELRSKASNRDSSSSNDSGVSTSTHFQSEFLEFETLVTPFSNLVKISAPAPSPKRSKSTEPLQDLSFQFSEIKTNDVPPPLCPKKEFFKDLSMSSSSGTSTIPYIDSVSTSSGASDMSDYIETLSLSSYSSSDAQDSRLPHPIATVLKPRSGKEYQKIDRSTIEVLTGRHQRQTEQTTEASPGYVSSPSN